MHTMSAIGCRHCCGGHGSGACIALIHVGERRNLKITRETCHFFRPFVSKRGRMVNTLCCRPPGGTAVARRLRSSPDCPCHAQSRRAAGKEKGEAGGSGETHPMTSIVSLVAHFSGLADSDQRYPRSDVSSFRASCGPHRSTGPAFPGGPAASER